MVLLFFLKISTKYNKWESRPLASGPANRNRPAVHSLSRAALFFD